LLLLAAALMGLARGFVAPRLAGAGRALRCTSESGEAPAAAETEVVDESGEDLDALKAKVRELEDANRKMRTEIEAEENKLAAAGERGYYALVAQMENYRKTQAASRERIDEQSLAEVVRAFVPVLETFESLPAELRNEIAEAADSESEVSSFINSYDTVGRQLWAKLSAKGLAKFDVQPGALFDPVRHEMVEDLGEDADKGGLVDAMVYEGIALGSSVVKKAGVAAYRVVAEAEEEATAEGEDAADEEPAAEDAEA